jgi:endonuclease/exonuclease/phosphatase family metal-dependent hydrolase
MPRPVPGGVVHPGAPDPAGEVSLDFDGVNGDITGRMTYSVDPAEVVAGSTFTLTFEATYHETVTVALCQGGTPNGCGLVEPGTEGPDTLTVASRVFLGTAADPAAYAPADPYIGDEPIDTTFVLEDRLSITSSSATLEREVSTEATENHWSHVTVDFTYRGTAEVEVPDDVSGVRYVGFLSHPVEAIITYAGCVFCDTPGWWEDGRLAAIRSATVPTPDGGDGPGEAAASVTVMTWNVHGSARHESPSAYAEVVAAAGASVVGLQEISFDQAVLWEAALIDATGGPWTCSWAYKHTTLVFQEGHALCTTLPVTDTAEWVLRDGYGSTRRILVRAVLDAGGGESLHVYLTHLSPGPDMDGIYGRIVERAQIARQLEADRATFAGEFRPLLLGDLNERPDGIGEYEEDWGLVDAWPAVGGHVADCDGNAGPECGWTSTAASPSQRIDYVLSDPDRLAVETASVPCCRGDEGFDVYADLSDHLPLTATLRLTG